MVNLLTKTPNLAYKLKEGEFFKTARICYCKKPVGLARVTRLCGAKFTTTLGNFVSVNMGDSGQYDYSSSTKDCSNIGEEGKLIVGLTGMYKSGGEMTYLGAYLASERLIKEKITAESADLSSSVSSTPISDSNNNDSSSVSGSGSSSSQCTDLQPPGRYSCSQQASWGKCGESWMVGKCNKSCGRCQ